MIKHILLMAIMASLAGCYSKQPTVTTGFEGKPMPSFNLLLMDSVTKINTTSIPAGKPIVMFYLNPYCPYCRAQTEDLISEMKSVSNIQFYLFSNFPFGQIRQYYSHYKLKDFKNITVGQDYDSYFGTVYKATAVPYIAIYSPDKHLKQVLIGKVGMSAIKDIAFQ